MSLLYLAVRIFPFWAVPLAFVFLDVGKHYRRRMKPQQFIFLGVAGLLFSLTLAWLFFGGYSNYQAWVDALF